MSNNPHIGSSFGDFLKEEGILEEINEYFDRICNPSASHPVSGYPEAHRNKCPDDDPAIRC
jgi:hypothetical protein